MRTSKVRLRTVVPAIAIVVIMVGLALGGWVISTAPSAKAESPGPSIAPAGGQSYTVTAVPGYAFQESTTELQPNTTVSISFVNADVIAHTYTLIAVQGKVIPTSYSPSQLATYESQWGAIVWINATGTGTYPATFQAPAIGWYEFVCMEPGHFQQAMYGFIAFGMSLPSNLTVTSPNVGAGWPVYVITATIVSLVIITIVLGFVVGGRKGAKHEMPPERLGYPESPPSAPPLPPESPKPPG
ncbi:MAG: hypothetical protein WAN74_03875 [Thermoplasmata archaeon]